jgi:hypothetical protein
VMGTAGLVPQRIVRLARDLASVDANTRSLAARSLLSPGVLDHAWNSARTRRAVLANELPVGKEVSEELDAGASILDRLRELHADTDMRVRVAAKEASLLVRAWEDIEAGRTPRPLLEGVPVRSLALLRVYRDVRSYWLRPLVRVARRLGAALYVRLRFVGNRGS